MDRELGYILKSGGEMGDPVQARQQPAPQTPIRNKIRGPRSLWIDRWENSFGFRLRHFIVYPPESYKLLARDKKFGLSQGGSSALDEAMDTMFVMAVQRGSSAEAAGLVVGDRIVSINGNTVAGKTYAEVVQQIQKTPDRLHLLVVPGEEDIIQQYYRDTAHNPKTNVRPRLKSPEVAPEQRRAVAVSTRQRTSISPKIARTAVMQQQLHPINVLQPGAPYIENEPIYNQLTWPDQKIGTEGRCITERIHVKTQLSRRPSDCNSTEVQAEPLSVIKPTSPNPSAFYPNSSGCRLSLDGGLLDRRESSSSSTLTDDSMIMLRIRKSCEQKEEFLRSTVKPTYPHIIAREFYARPQKLQKPIWPPQSPELEPGADSRGKALPAAEERQAQEAGTGKQFLRTLTMIRENLQQGYESRSLETDLDEITTMDSSISRSQSEESEILRRGVTQPKLHIVSRRAKQFETGQLEEEDKTHFYRSELARLSGKRNVPNVAFRKQEFEQLVERKPSARETRSQEPCVPKSGSSLSGNRTTIVGSKNLHAEPPNDFQQLEPEVAEDVSPKPRPRSNSMDSWSSKDGEHSTKRSLHGVSIDRAKDEEKQRHKAVRQDSYLAAVKTISSNNARPRRIIKRQISCRDSDESSAEEKVCSRHSLPLREVYRRPNRLYLPHNGFATESYKVPPNTVPITTVASDVVRRQRKLSSSAEDERSTRRVSYLKATSSDQINVDIDADTTNVVQKSHKKWMYPMLPGEIQRLRRIFEEYSGMLESGCGESTPRRLLIDGSRPDEKENLKIVKEGWMNCKVALIDGKRAGDRSWKQMWAVLRGPFFSLQKDKQTEQSEQTVDVRNSCVDIPQDYTKRKYVLRLKTDTETEYLLQAEDTSEMEHWKKALEEQSEASVVCLSPQAAQKGSKKAPTLRTRSPTGQSPASKNRKPSQQDQIPSPKSKTWKGKLGKQFRKMQQGSGSPSSAITYPEGATMKVPLELCPPSSISEFIPMIVEKCTSIVEARGLDIVGIYRVPGNTAAVTALTEAVNKGIELMNPEDPRWNDVNVISSLLKSFFRNLPDCLFTSELYPKFIAADKIGDPKFRMVTLRKLINELPDHNYETLRHVLFHLKKVVSNSAVNKMETRNLAIVFGPTLLSTGDLMALVTDTSHQCRIVESLISHVDWFFSADDVEALNNLVLPMSTESQSAETSGNASLLLGNIRKVEGFCRGDHLPNKDMSPMDIVSSIISAANRKMSKSKSKKLEKTLTNCDIENKTTSKKTGAKQDVEQSTSVAASIVSSFVGDIARASNDDLDGSVNRHLAHSDVIRSYSRLDTATWGERIRRFEQETQAMLKRDPVRMRKETEKWLADKQFNVAKLAQSKRELENEDLLDNPSDLSRNSNMTQLSSQSEEGTLIRRGTSYESLSETTTPNGSLKRFRSGRENGSLRGASSLDSLHGKTKNEASDDDNDLVISITKTFDEKLKSYMNESDSSSLGDENKNTDEKAEFENVIEKESKLIKRSEGKSEGNGEKLEVAKGRKNKEKEEEEEEEDEEEEEEEDEEDGKKSKVKIDPRIREKLKRFEVSETILRAKNAENATNLKRSESLTKPEKPEMYTKLRRSESLNKSEKSNDFTKLKRSDSSKNDLKRSDSLTKNEKTETNINKRKQQEAGLKRSSSKEKENVMFVKMKRKNGMPDRSIKRRHTVGGTKDFDKLPWLDNRLQTEALEKEETGTGKEKRNFRTSSPDLSSSRLQATIESEGLSIEVSLLGSRGNVLATLRKPLIPPAPAGRPQSMPPVSQLFKLPLESHV